MAKDIVQSLLNDSEYGCLQFCGEPGELCGLKIERGADATALGESPQEPGDGGTEADLIEQRRMQEMGNAADLLERALNHGAGV